MLLLTGCLLTATAPPLPKASTSAHRCLPSRFAPSPNSPLPRLRLRAPDLSCRRYVSTNTDRRAQAVRPSALRSFFF